ncbi:hypothetical protein F5Y17DRAFT_461228 [Xylariaceae sp. FL0594]|nr:hypothetical protein F5Y17DRAFT_461228 [Xylariaceae sp. FL0594]
MSEKSTSTDRDQLDTGGTEVSSCCRTSSDVGIAAPAPGRQPPEMDPEVTHLDVHTLPRPEVQPGPVTQRDSESYAPRPSLPSLDLARPLRLDSGPGERGAGGGMGVGVEIQMSPDNIMTMMRRFLRPEYLKGFDTDLKTASDAASGDGGNGGHRSIVGPGIATDEGARTKGAATTKAVQPSGRGDGTRPQLTVVTTSVGPDIEAGADRTQEVQVATPTTPASTPTLTSLTPPTPLSTAPPTPAVSANPLPLTRLNTNVSLVRSPAVDTSPWVLEGRISTMGDRGLVHSGSDVDRLDGDSNGWGVLFDQEGYPTARCGEVFRGLARCLAEDVPPRTGFLVTPEKLSFLYSRFRIEGEVYPFEDIFHAFHADRRFLPTASPNLRSHSGINDICYKLLSHLFADLGCEFYLIPESSFRSEPRFSMPKTAVSPNTGKHILRDDTRVGFSTHRNLPRRSELRPSMPALTLGGFAHFFTTCVLAYPDEEAGRMNRIASELSLAADIPVLRPSNAPKSPGTLGATITASNAPMRYSFGYNEPVSPFSAHLPSPPPRTQEALCYPSIPSSSSSAYATSPLALGRYTAENDYGSDDTGSGGADVGGRLPRRFPRHLFPSKPDTNTRKLLKAAVEDYLADLTESMSPTTPNSSSSSFASSFGPPNTHNSTPSLLLPPGHGLQALRNTPHTLSQRPSSNYPSSPGGIHDIPSASASAFELPSTGLRPVPAPVKQLQDQIQEGRRERLEEQLNRRWSLASVPTIFSSSPSDRTTAVPPMAEVMHSSSSAGSLVVLASKNVDRSDNISQSRVGSIPTRTGYHSHHIRTVSFSGVPDGRGEGTAVERAQRHSRGPTGSSGRETSLRSMSFPSSYSNHGRDCDNDPEALAEPKDYFFANHAGQGDDEEMGDMRKVSHAYTDNGPQAHGNGMQDQHGESSASKYQASNSYSGRQPMKGALALGPSQPRIRGPSFEFGPLRPSSANDENSNAHSGEESASSSESTRMIAGVGIPLVSTDMYTHEITRTEIETEIEIELSERARSSNAVPTVAVAPHAGNSASTTEGDSVRTASGVLHAMDKRHDGSSSNNNRPTWSEVIRAQEQQQQRHQQKPR